MSRPCQCPQPGFCPRYNQVMTEELHATCRSSPGYRRVWDATGGPFRRGQPRPSQGCMHQGAYTGRQVECILDPE